MKTPMEILVHAALENTQSKPLDERIKIYEAVAKLTPKSELGQMAGRIAFGLKEASDQQMKFQNLLKGGRL